jgi:hypothetical protein
MSSPLHNRKIKQIVFDVGGSTFQCQVEIFNFVNNTEDGEKIYAMCPNGEDIEETDPNWTFTATLFADWRSDGVSDFMMEHDGENVAITVEHHPDIPAEHTIWEATVRLKAPGVGGQVKQTERQEISWQVIGKPAYSRAA